MATSDHTVGFEPADRLAEDRESVRRRFWIKLKQVVAKLPFAEDLLAAYYCAFDKQTPRHVQAMPRYWLPPFAWSQATSRRSIAMPPARR